MNKANKRLKELTAILLLLLSITTLLPVSAFASDIPTATAAITVEKKMTGDIPPGAEAFVFTLTPDDANYPMPEETNGNILTIQGAGTASFGEITYAEPGTYTYTVRENPGNAPNYTYDNTVYQVTVYVTTDDAGNLTANARVTKNAADGKFSNAVFANAYKRPTGPNNPHTGDTTDLSLWINLAWCSVAVLIVLLIGGKRRKEKNRQP